MPTAAGLNTTVTAICIPLLGEILKQTPCKNLKLLIASLKDQQEEVKSKKRNKKETVTFLSQYKRNLCHLTVI